MATYYWVGGNGIWDKTNTSNWAITSGGAGGAGFPTSTDDVIFDANSNTTSYSVSVGSSSTNAANGRNVTIYGPASGTVTVSNTGAYFNLGGSFYANSSNVVLVTTTGTYMSHTPTSNSTLYIPMTFGVNYTLNSSNPYEVTFSSNITFSGTATINGSLNTAGYMLTCTGFTSTVGTSRSLKLGTSVINVVGNAFQLNGTGLTALDAANSTLLYSALPGNINFTGASVNMGNLAYQAVGAPFTISSVNPVTFNNISFPRTNNTTSMIRSIGVISANKIDFGSPLNAYSRVFLQSADGSTVILSANTINNFKYIDFLNITGQGAFVANGSYLGDLGGNSGLSFENPTTIYWAGPSTGGFIGTANVWSTVDGGAANSALYPLPQHTIKLTDTVLAASSTIALNNQFTSACTYYQVIGTIDGSSRTNPLKLNQGGSTTNPALIWSGDILNNVGSISTVSSGATSYFYGKRNTTISTGAGIVFNGSTYVDKYTASLTMVDDYATNLFSFYSGTLNLNTNLNCTRFVGYDSGNTTKPHIINSNNASITAATLGATSSSPFDLTYAGGGTVINGPLTVTLLGSGSTPTTVYTPLTLASANINFQIISGSGTYPLTISGYANNIVFFSGFSGSLAPTTRTIYGSLTLSPNMTVAPSTLVTTFSTGVSNAFIKTSNVAMPIPITIFTQGSGSFTALDNLNMGTSAFTISPYGTFNANNNNITCGSVNVPTACAATKIITMGNGTWNITGNAWNMLATNITIYPNNSTIILSNNTISKTFVGGSSQTYYNLVIGGIGNTTISGNNTFNNITNTISPANVIFTSNNTQTVSNFGLSGNSGNLISIYSTSPNYKSTLVKSGAGTITVNYLNISSSNAYPTLTWYANNSSNVSNVIGWIFNANPITMVTTGNFFAFF